MATQQEIPIGDDELDALMAELEDETKDMVVVPTASAPAAAEAVDFTPDDQEVAEMEALEAELNAQAAPAPEPAPAPVAKAEPAPAPAPTPTPAPAPAVGDVDAEMAALEAELNGVVLVDPEPAPEPKPVPAPVAAPAPAPAPAPEPKPAPVLKAVPAPAPAAEPPAATQENTPAKQPASLQFFIDVEKFRDDTKVSANNLDDCMMQQAGLHAFYSEQASRAEAQHDRLKARFKVLEAQLYDQHRKALLASGEKVTEKAVENAVLADPKWIKNQNVIIEAQTIANINRGLVESLRSRKDMLVQLGADRREEGKGQLRMMAVSQEHADNKARAMAAATR